MAKTEKRKRQPKETDEDDEEVDQEAEEEEEEEREPPTSEGDRSFEIGSSGIKHVLEQFRDEIVAHRKKQIAKLAKTARGKKDEILARQAELVNVTHATELNIILTTLNTALSSHDESLSQLWTEISQLDETTHQAHEKYNADMQRISDEVQKMREGCLAVIERVLADHAKLSTGLLRVDELDVGANSTVGMVRAGSKRSSSVSKRRMTDVSVGGA